MGQTVETLEPVKEALVLIDKGLVGMIHRELVSTSEASDLLLDLRSMLLNEVIVEPA